MNSPLPETHRTPSSIHLCRIWPKLRALLLGSLCFAPSAAPLLAESAEPPAVVQIQSRWIGQRFIFEGENGEVRSGALSGQNGDWALEPQDGDYRLRNVASNGFLVMADDSTEVVMSPKAPESDRGIWIIEPSDDGVVISNRAERTFLNIQNPDQPVSAGMDKRPSQKNWTSGLWNLVPVSGSEPRFYKKGQITVAAPAYGEKINGKTRMEIMATGFNEVEIRSWMPGGRFGQDASLGKVSLTEGRGVFEIPAEKLPRGPITIKIHGVNGKMKNNCYWMLYNQSGISWNEGAPQSPPPAAKDMTLAFLDEFDNPELSITKDGAGAKYASHKVGGGDFSGIPFGDHENADTTPFSVIDTYLRIRADQSKRTTGLISSVREDGTGFTVKAPCYFECRFIAQSAPGTWPAFWAMTNYMIKDPDIKPLRRTSDELDVVEAYGGEGPKTPNAPGYMIHTHYWNQGKDGKKDYTQDRFAGPIHMTKLPGGGGGSWYETPHTYGVLVTKDHTVYYCDDIEVARHKTGRLSASEPLFFYVNLAVGGASGWHIDLTQYGGKADMYVDYVRVYQGKQ